MTSSVISDSMTLSRDLHPRGLFDLNHSRQHAVEPDEVGDRHLGQVSSKVRSSSDASGNENWNSPSNWSKNLGQSLLSSAFRAADDDDLIQLDSDPSDVLGVSHVFNVNSTKDSTKSRKYAGISPSLSHAGHSKDDVQSPTRSHAGPSKDGVQSLSGRDRDSALSHSIYPVTDAEALTDVEASQALRHPPFSYERSIPHLEHVPLIADISETLTSSVAARSASYSVAHRPEVDKHVSVADSSVQLDQYNKLHHVVSTNKLEPKVPSASMSPSMNVGKSRFDVDHAGAPTLHVGLTVSPSQANKDNMLQSSVTRFQSERNASDHHLMTLQPSAPTGDVLTISQAHRNRRRSRSPKSAEENSRHDQKLTATVVNTIHNSRLLNADGVQWTVDDVKYHPSVPQNPSQSNLPRAALPSVSSSLWVDITESVKTSYPPDKVEPPSRPRSSETADTTSGSRFVEESPRGPRGNIRSVTFSDQQPTTAAVKSVVTSHKKSNSITKYSSASKVSYLRHSSPSKEKQDGTLLNGTNKSTRTAADYNSSPHHNLRGLLESPEDSGDEKILSRLRKEVENYRNLQ